MKRIVGTLMVLVLIALFGMPTVSSAYSLNAYNGTSGKGLFGLSPAVYSSYDPEFSLDLDPIVCYGFSDKFDIFVNPAILALVPEVGYGGTWIFPRYDLGNNNILGLQMIAAYEASAFAFSLAPQYHYFLEKDKFAFELNAIMTVPLEIPDVSEARLILAPVWKVFPDKLNLFLEIDTYTTINDFASITFDLIPGACVTVGEGQICVGVVLGDLRNGLATPGVNLWYFQGFGGE